VVNAVRPLLHTLANADPNEAVRRLAILCLRNASPQPDTIRLLHGLAEDEDQERQLRDAARKVGDVLRKKAPGR
jgi:HEAT repeat protein